MEETVRDQAPRLKCVSENCFSYFSTKTHVVGTQKNRLNEMVPFKTQNACIMRMHVFLLGYIMATNSAPSSHIPVGLTFYFVILRAKF